MDREQVHFEVFTRKKPNSVWALEFATESRSRALEEAEALLKEKRAVSVRVTKETLDLDTREFKMVVLLTKGEPDRGKTRKARTDFEPLCVSPQDLYTGHARDRIGRLLEAWLQRNRITPFELLHRADLIERLEAEGMDLQHAIQKIAIPEAQARGASVHEIIRSFQRLVQASIDRVMKDARRGAFPKIDTETFAEVVEKLAGEPDRHYLLGGAIAKMIGEAGRWSDKVNMLLDLADAAPTSPAGRALALQVLEQPLGEVLGSRAGLGDLIGPDLDLGGSLAAMTRLAAAESVEALANIEPSVARVMPPLKDSAARLANWLDGPHFENVRASIAKRVLKELSGPRRLRPDDAEGEIAILRALAMALTAASGRLMTLEEVQTVFVERSSMLVRSDFVEAYLEKDRTALGEVQALLWLAENVTGHANKRHASRWISATVGSLRFETSVRQAAETAPVKLAALANLQRAVGRAGLIPEETGPIIAKLGDVGGLVEADAKLVHTLGRSTAPVVSRLNALLRLATGESAPVGPAADRAKAEALKLLRVPGTRAELAQAPEAVERVRGMLQTLGLAA
jgi:hypothetical protein